MMDDFRYPPANSQMVQCTVEAVPAALFFSLFFGATYIAFSRLFYVAILPEIAIFFGRSSPHGEMLVLMTLLMMVLGSFVGVAIPVARRFSFFAAAAVLGAGVICLAGGTAFLWEVRQRQHGYDPADCLLFITPLCTAGAVGAGAMILAWYGWSVRMRSLVESDLL